VSKLNNSRAFNIINLFKKDQSGSIAIISAAVLMTLIIAAGMSSDMGRMTIVNHKLQQAIDSAALAAAGSAGSLSASETENKLRRYFSLNFPDQFMSTDIISQDVQVTFLPNSYNPEKVEIVIESEITAQFIGDNEESGSKKRLPVGSEVEVIIPETGTVPADINLVMDFSGSMGWVGCRYYSHLNKNCTGDPSFDGKTRSQQLNLVYDDFIENIFSNEETKDYRIATVAYAHYIKGSIAFSQSTSALKQFFKSTAIGGGTYGAWV